MQFLYRLVVVFPDSIIELGTELMVEFLVSLAGNVSPPKQLLEKETAIQNSGGPTHSLSFDPNILPVS